MVPPKHVIVSFQKPWAGFPSECSFSGCFKKNAELAPWCDWKTNLPCLILFKLLETGCVLISSLVFHCRGFPLNLDLRQLLRACSLRLCVARVTHQAPATHRLSERKLQSNFKALMPKNDSSAWIWKLLYGNPGHFRSFRSYKEGASKGQKKGREGTCLQI